MQVSLKSQECEWYVIEISPLILFKVPFLRHSVSCFHLLLFFILFLLVSRCQHGCSRPFLRRKLSVFSCMMCRLLPWNGNSCAQCLECSNANKSNLEKQITMELSRFIFYKNSGDANFVVWLFYACRIFRGILEPFESFWRKDQEMNK